MKAIEAHFRTHRDDFRLHVDLTLAGHGVTALFGPSGCGKTSLLRAIAGLEPGIGGSLRVGEEIWQDKRRFLPPHKRPVAYVFQEPSLFPHLNVRDNLQYGLKRLSRRKRRVSLNQAVELLGIGELLQRKPQQLSGGEQQRVAIARALAVSPALLLMDEPLAALDEKLKQEILPWLESLHRELEIPVLYVSHSRDEVARLADHLVLLKDGEVEAAGSVSDLFSRLDLSLAHRPDTETVIETIVAGYDGEFRLSALSFPGGRFRIADRPALGRHARLQVKANDVSITLQWPEKTSILNIFPATVDALADDGEARVVVRLMLDGNIPLLARITRKSAVDLELEPGKPVFAQVKSVALLS